MMRTAAYGGLALAGVVLQFVVGLLPGIAVELWRVMAAWLVIGGLACVAGQVRRRWTGEFVGLPLLSSALFGFGILQGNVTDWPLEVAPSVAILWAFSLALGARWVDVTALYRASRRREER